jgi:hypothetical protein
MAATAPLIITIPQDKLFLSVETLVRIRPAFVSCGRGTTD